MSACTARRLSWADARRVRPVARRVKYVFQICYYQSHRNFGLVSFPSL